MVEINIRVINLDEIHYINQIQVVYENSFASGTIEDSWEEILEDFEYGREIHKLPSNKGLKFYLIGAILHKKVVGFTFLKFYHEFSYVNYLAVDKKFQNRSITTGLCDKIIELSLKDAEEYQTSEPIIFGEARKPELARDEEERLGFLRVYKVWQHIGLHLLDCDYFAPDKSNNIRPMRLMIYPLARQEFISSEILIRRVKILYEQEYDLPPEKVEIYLSMLRESIKGREKIFGLPT